jgi:hypothetical protein
MDNNKLNLVESLIKLLVENKLDVLEVDGIKIYKTKHDFIHIQTKSKETDDDLLWSVNE